MFLNVVEPEVAHILHLLSLVSSVNNHDTPVEGSSVIHALLDASSRIVPVKALPETSLEAEGPDVIETISILEARVVDSTSTE